MKNSKQAVKDLLILYKEMCIKGDVLEELGIKIELGWEQQISDIALDIIGFPKDNTLEYYNSNKDIMSDVELSNNLEDMFCRDYFDEEIISYVSNRKKSRTIDELVSWLYQEKESLLKEI